MPDYPRHQVVPDRNKRPGVLRVHILSLIFLPLVISQLPCPAYSQEKITGKEIPDSVMEKKHNPTKATLMSTFLPGLGQIYNRKYWKVPVIYVGFGIMTYFIATNTDEYITYKCAYIEKSNGSTNGSYADLVNKYTAEELLSAREYYRRNLEISILITAVWYAVNILDATVDAHLFTYNISKDLSMKVHPVLLEPVNNTRFYSGMRLTFKF